MAQRRQRSAEFKAKVALEAIRGQRTTNEIASTYEVHPIQVSQWKKQVLDELPHLFSKRRAKAAQEEEALRAQSRFRKDSATYLAAAEALLLQPSLPP